MTCRECGNESKELYGCRICEGGGLCAECAMLCEEDLPFTAIITEPAGNETGCERCDVCDGLYETAMLYGKVCVDCTADKAEREWTESAENEPPEWPDDDIYRGEGDLEC